MKELKSELAQGQTMLNQTASLGEKVCLTTSPRGQDLIQREVESLRDDWKSFSAAFGDVEHNLEVSISHWMQLDEEHLNFSNWLERIEARVRSCLETKSNQTRKRSQLQEGEVSGHFLNILICLSHILYSFNN